MGEEKGGGRGRGGYGVREEGGGRNELSRERGRKEGWN